MKRLSAILITFFLIIPVFISAQQKEDKFRSQIIDNKSKDLDRQILDLYKNIERVIANSDIMSPEGVKYLPYQTDIFYGPNKDKPEYLELVKHMYIKESFQNRNLIGYEEKVLRIYTNGKTVSKLETIIKIRNFRLQSEEILTVVDPSPGSESKDNIVLDHVRNGKKIVDQKKLGEIINNIDIPIKNEIKAEFMIPHLVSLYRNLVFITEANLMDATGADMNMSDFLIRSTNY